jgi:transposase InsO family protein
MAPQTPPPGEGVASHHPPAPEPRRHRHTESPQAPQVLLPRFEAAMLNETWQSDFTYRLTRPDGSPGADTEIISWLDDHSRYALHVTAHQPVTAKTVLNTFRQAADLYGYPASTLTDNGMVYTVRLAGHGRGGGNNSFEAELRRLDIVQKNSRPSRPTTCGKVERFQQTLKKWLRAQPEQPTSLNQLQALLDAFIEEYNHHRPHRSLPHRATPRDHLHDPPQSHPDRRPQHRQPRPDPPRHRVERRQRHAAHRRTTPPHRHGPNLRPEPASSCSSTTFTSASSTRSPANSSATSSSTPARTTSPRTHPNDTPQNLHPQVRLSGMS